VISRKAIQEFRERELKSYAHVHDWTLRYCRQAVQKLPARPPIWKKLSKVQKIALLVGIENPKFLFMLDCVAGETEIETSEGPRRIDKLSEEGQPIFV